MTNECFAECFVLLEAYCGRTITREVRQLYKMRLSAMDDVQFRFICGRLVETFKPTTAEPFPLIHNFLELSGDNGNNAALLSLSVLKKAVSRVGAWRSIVFVDRALAASVDVLGGWIAVCNMTAKDWDINTGRFLEHYKMAKSMNMLGPIYFPGHAELHNGVNCKQNRLTKIEYCNKTGKILIHKTDYALLDDNSTQKDIDLDPIINKIGEYGK